MQGVVETASVKPTKKEGLFRHAFKVNGEYYSFFAKSESPKANNGDTVEFDFKEENGFKNINVPTFQVVQRGSAPQSAGRAQNDDRQGSIMRQSSMNYAVQQVGAEVAAGRLKNLNSDEIACEVIRLADDYYLRYAESGERVDKQNNHAAENDQSQQQDHDDEPF